MSATNIDEKNQGIKMPLILSGKDRKKLRKITLGFGKMKEAAIKCSLSRDTLYKAIKGKEELSEKSFKSIQELLANN